MKTLLLILGFITLSFSLKAQDCMTFFPNNTGTIMINKSYDAQNNLLSTTTYKVQTVYDYQSGNDMQISFVMTNNKDTVVDHGNIIARCDDGIFYLKMDNRTISPDVMKYLGANVELVSDFLDYPDVFNTMDTPGTVSDFQMSGGSFTVQSKDKKKWMRVLEYNRQYVKTEDITTPARTEPFKAAKVTFDIEITKDKKTTKYTGIEWYAQGAGIIRAETYDNTGKLLNYTVLTSLKDAK